MGRSRKLGLLLLVAASWFQGACRALAQAQIIERPQVSEPGSTQSSLGPIPGSGGNPFGNSPGTDAMLLGGRVGPSFPRVPTTITTPGGAMAPPEPQGIAAPRRLPITNVPLFGPLEVPDVAEVEGPPDGLTLEAAIDRLLRENLALRSRFAQIPKVRADVLAASLRANPILFADGQFVPYGSYSRARTGGPTQYDLNITHPFDVSHKRQARTLAAERVVSVLEAQFQDAVRLEIDNLSTAFVDVLAARETVRYAEASLAGLGKVLAATEALYQKANTTRPDVYRIKILRDAAELGVLQARETLQRTKRTLGTLLNLPTVQAEALQLRGTITDLAPPPPPPNELVRIALAIRPDLIAQRLEVGRAEADLRLARANRFGDVYLLYQPYTFQNNAPFGNKSSTSWALGATVPLPIYNRNEGGVLRARLNCEQTQTEVATRERRVVTEVLQAESEYAVTRAAVERLETVALPAAQQLRDDTFMLYTRGEQNAVDYYHAQRDYNEIVRRYRDLTIRHRRSMLKLNTAVGQRVLP